MILAETLKSQMDMPGVFTICLTGGHVIKDLQLQRVDKNKREFMACFLDGKANTVFILVSSMIAIVRTPRPERQPT